MNKVKVSLFVGLVLLTALAITGCQPTATPPQVERVVETVVVTVVVEPTQLPPPAPTPPPDHSDIMLAWEQSPHGNTYDLGKGPNTYCSRCHSPQNWDPEATTDRPPNCVTCKFDFDPELRNASTMEFVAEEDWVGINCETCHRVQDGVVQEGIAWLSPLTHEYIDVATPNELCTKCHLTSQGVSASGGRGVTHEIYLGGSAHKNWAGVLSNEKKPDYCTDCHDPHSQQPKDCVSCHEINETEHAMGNYAKMADKVSCMGCHEADGMAVGPHPDPAKGGIWVPIVTEVGRTGEVTSTAVISHSINWLVSCDRCHFDGNNYELPVLTAEGKPVEVEAGG